MGWIIGIHPNLDHTPKGYDWIIKELDHTPKGYDWIIKERGGIIAKAKNKAEYIKAWQMEIMSLNSLSHDAISDLELALKIQDHMLELKKMVEQVADILVEEGVIPLN